jgi:RNA polymerase-binding transcription factor DksA
MPPTSITPAETDALEAALLAEQEATAHQLDHLQRDFQDFVDASELVATDDEHDPEGATIAFERQQVAALRDQAAEHLAELADALERLRSGEYGTCELCRDPVGVERLTARPATRRCIRCATKA